MAAGFILFFIVCIECACVEDHIAAVLVVVVEPLHVFIGWRFHIEHR
jgi:hypothetical protein